MKNKLFDFFENISWAVKNVYSVLFLIAEIFLCLIRVFKLVDISLASTVVGCIAVALFLLCKDADETGKHRYTWITLFTIILAMSSLCFSKTFGMSKISGVFYLVVTVALLIIIPIVIMLVPDAKIAFNAIASADMHHIGEQKVRNPGDALLGYEIKPKERWKDPNKPEGDIRKPVLIPEKDRYVHMLTLGATGTGKTSQILLPMIYNDIKDNKLGVIVLEPKGDFAEKVFALSLKEDRKVVYFNPVLKECPYFNPLRGKEVDVIENMVTTFNTFDSDSSTFFKTNNEMLLRRAIKVLKRLYGDDATMIQLEELISNVGNRGLKMIREFDKLNAEDESILQDNRSISSWFIDDYFTGITGQRGSTKTYEQTSGIRNQISKIVSNKYLRRVLNPPKTSELRDDEYIDFDRVLRNGEVLAVTSNQGALRELSTYLGYFLILQLESAVFRRPGNEDTRRGCVVCIDEFQTYSNPSFADMLTQGRSYRVACVLATQNRGLIGMNSGSKAKSFTELVSTNARNLVLFPDANVDDAKYYSQQFGEIMQLKEKVSVSRQRFFASPLDDRESVSVDEKYENRFSSSDIIFQPFGQVISFVINHNTRQFPVKTKIEFIPKEVNDYIDKFLKDFKLENEISENELADIEKENIAPSAAGDMSDIEDISDYEVLGDVNDVNLVFDDEKIIKNNKSKMQQPVEDIAEEVEDDDF